MEALQLFLDNFADWDSLRPHLAAALAGPAAHRPARRSSTLPIAVAVGLLIAILYSFHNKALNVALLIWIDLFRSFPVLVLLILIFYGLPFLGLTLPSFAACVLALTLNNSGYYGEIFRAGIESIPPGQREAARALGLHPLQIIFLVILPQAIARVLAPLASNSLELVKTTSIAALVALPELLRSARVAQEQTYNPTPLTAAAIIFFVLLWPVRPLGGEARARHDHEAEMKRLAGKTALITGASSGIGRAIAKKFHEEGAELLLMDITEQVVEGGEPTHKILDVPFFQGDVSKEADVEEAVRRAAGADRPARHRGQRRRRARGQAAHRHQPRGMEPRHGGQRDRRVPDVPRRGAPHARPRRSATRRAGASSTSPRSTA